MARLTITTSEPITILELYLRVTGTTRVEAADTIGVNRNTIQAIAEGRTPSPELAVALSETYQLPLRALLKGDKHDKWTVEVPSGWVEEGFVAHAG